MQIQKSKELFEKAQKFIPGGVNSPVRAFKAVGGDPLFIKSAKGAYIYDADGNAYMEFFNSWGPMLLGHANEQIEQAVAESIKDSLSFGAPTEREVEIAELIVSMVPSIEKVRMVNSGTEATMSAIRLARGFTSRDKIIKFEGCYHGHGDSFLIAAGSGVATMGTPDSPGVTKGTALDTLTAPFNDIEAVEALVKANPYQIAAIIIEPVAGNMGCIPPKKGFLEAVRKICDENGIILIFDEVMTGFRLAKGGAQELLGVTPDLTTLGKIIGGGMPVGAYGGKKEIMEFVSPLGPVYQAGTLSGNPVAMAAGLAMLRQIQKDKSLYELLNLKTTKIADGLRKICSELGYPYTVNQLGSMVSLHFTAEEVVDFKTIKTADTALFGKFFRAMLNRGFYLPPSQFETWFISTAIGDAEIDKLLTAVKASLVEIHN